MTDRKRLSELAMEAADDLIRVATFYEQETIPDRFQAKLNRDKADAITALLDENDRLARLCEELLEIAEYWEPGRDRVAQIRREVRAVREGAEK